VIQVVPFRVQHLAFFKPGVWDEAAMKRSDFASIAHGWDNHDQAASLILGDRVLAIGGIAVTDREGLAWIFASNELRAMPVLLHRMTKRILGLVIEKWALERVVAEVPFGFDRCHRWVARLGFSPIHEEEAFTRYEMRA
jgi:hypothetical protein